jgi:aspartate/methionine/tyrosine aminotransferase
MTRKQGCQRRSAIMIFIRRTTPSRLHRGAAGRPSPLYATARLAGLREAMARLSTRATGVETTVGNVIAMPGGQAALYAAVQGTLDAGDHAIVVAPYYATYPGTFRAAGAEFTVVEARSEDGFQPRRSDIERRSSRIPAPF